MIVLWKVLVKKIEKGKYPDPCLQEMQGLCPNRLKKYFSQRQKYLIPDYLKLEIF